jgi:polysaccharide biosynthesis transport protein
MPTEQMPSNFDLRWSIAMVRRHIVLIVAVALIAGLAGVLWTMQQTPMYRASALISVGAPLASSGGGGASIDERSIAGEIDILGSGTTREAVSEKIGATGSVSFDKSSGESNIRITVTSEDPERAALVANTYAEVYAQIRLKADVDRNQEAIDVLSERLAEVEDAIRTGSTVTVPADGANGTVIGTTASDLDTQRRTYQSQLTYLEDQARFIARGRVTILDPATVPSSPYSPSMTRNLAIALLIGLLAGVGLAFVRDQYNDTVDSVEDLDAATGGLPLLGVIPKDQEWTTTDETHIVSFEAPTSPLAEAYRTLRSSLQFARLDEPIEILQITSSGPFEGKSTTIANLGVTLSKAGQRVLIVDLDLRRPRLHKFFELDNDLGFTSLLDDASRDRLAIAVSPDAPNLGVLTSGPRPKDPSELLGSDAARRVITRLAASWDLILIDSPPVLGVSDPLVISGLADATLLIVRSSATRVAEVKSATDLLRKVQAPLVGTVVNSVDVSRRNYGYGSYGSYGYGYGYAYKYTYGETPSPASKD